MRYHSVRSSHELRTDIACKDADSAGACTLAAEPLENNSQDLQYMRLHAVICHQSQWAATDFIYCAAELQMPAAAALHSIQHASSMQILQPNKQQIIAQ